MAEQQSINLALLRFALTHTDSPNLHDFTPTRNPADYEWLRKALNNLETNADKMKKLLEITKHGLDEGECDSEIPQKVAALEEILFYVEDIDNANGMTSPLSIPSPPSLPSLPYVSIPSSTHHL